MLTTWPGPLVLVSASPRRAALLAAASIDYQVCSPGVDDGCLQAGSMDAGDWVRVLAVMKARSVAAISRGTLLGADTVCTMDGVLIGQPANADDAAAMLRSLCGRVHAVLTGWCLRTANGRATRSGCEVATVRVGDLDDQEIDAYVAGGAWRGKAGAYNLAERLEAGWPLACEGDPTSVMGLPMERLVEELARAPREAYA